MNPIDPEQHKKSSATKISARFSMQQLHQYGINVPSGHARLVDITKDSTLCDVLKDVITTDAQQTVTDQERMGIDKKDLDNSCNRLAALIDLRTVFDEAKTGVIDLEKIRRVAPELQKLYAQRLQWSKDSAGFSQQGDMAAASEISLRRQLEQATGMPAPKKMTAEDIAAWQQSFAREGKFLDFEAKTEAALYGLLTELAAIKNFPLPLLPDPDSKPLPSQ